MLLRWIDCDTKRKTSIVIRVNNFSGFSVPFLKDFVQTDRNKLSTVFGQIKASNNFIVSTVCTNTFPIPKHIPEFDSSIIWAREKIVTIFRKELDFLNSFWMSGPNMVQFLWNVPLLLWMSMIPRWRLNIRSSIDQLWFIMKYRICIWSFFFNFCIFWVFIFYYWQQL